MAKLSKRKIEETAERLNKDFSAYVTYIQENEIKLAKNTAHISKKDCFAINAMFLCQPENWEKATRVQNVYAELDFFYFCSLHLALFKVTKQGKAYIMEKGKRFEQFFQEDVVTRYCILLIVFFAEYLETGRAEFSFLSVVDMLEEAKTGEFLKEMGYRDWWHCANQYCQPIKVMDVLGLVDLVWAEETENLAMKDVCHMRARELGVCIAKSADFVEMCSMHDDPFADLWKQLCQVCGGNTEAFDLLVVEIEDKTGCVFYLQVSIANCIRKIKISGHCTLEDLHHSIQEAVDFDKDHMYCFTIGRERFKKEYFHPFCEQEDYLANEVKIGQLSLEEGTVFSYLFDFGDSWYFDIKVEKIIEGECEDAQVIESIGKAPIQYNEDVW